MKTPPSVSSGAVASHLEGSPEAENGAMPGGNRLLVIDDDQELCRMLRDYLRSEGFRVETRAEYQEGLKTARTLEHDLIILDVMLGPANGLELLRELRAFTNTPVIMLTAKGEDVDRIVGLELGADDYVPKPFNPRELTARIRAVLRRGVERGLTDDHPEGISTGDLEMDFTRRTATLAGKALALTGLEFEILKTLAENAGGVVTRELLHSKVFRRSMHPLDRSLNVHISNLRRKIHDVCGEVERIKTVHGVGYLLVPPL